LRKRRWFGKGSQVSAIRFANPRCQTAGSIVKRHIFTHATSFAALHAVTSLIEYNIITALPSFSDIVIKSI